MEIKQCIHCGEIKTLDNFYKRSDTKDGYRNECKICWKNKSKKYYEVNKENLINLNKIYYVNNKEEVLDKAKIYREINKIRIKEYRQNHRKDRSEYNNLKRRNDDLFNLKYKLRNRIYKSIKIRGFSKKSKTYEILGCSYEECLKYLYEKAKLRYSDFKPEDFLEKNKYHIDHIIPLETAKNEEEIIRLNHYTNLQLLKAEDNLRKSYKIL